MASKIAFGACALSGIAGMAAIVYGNVAAAIACLVAVVLTAGIGLFAEIAYSTNRKSGS